jgi:hypothetical protein
MHVELVAVAAGLTQVRLMALDRQVDLSNLVQILGDSLKRTSVQQADMPTARRRWPTSAARRPGPGSSSTCGARARPLWTLFGVAAAFGL